MSQILKIPKVKCNALGLGELRCSYDKLGWQHSYTKSVVIVKTTNIQSVETTHVANENFMMRITDKEGISYTFRGITKQYYSNLVTHITEVCRIPTFDENNKIKINKICLDGRNWGTIDIGNYNVLFNSAADPKSEGGNNDRAGTNRFTLPLDKINQVQVAGKTDLHVEFEEPEELGGDYAQELRFYIPQINGNSQVENIGNIIKEKITSKQNTLCLYSLKKLKFMQPSARFDLQFYYDHIRLHGQSFDHQIKYKDIRYCFELPTPRPEMYFVYQLITPVRQNQSTMNHLVIHADQEYVDTKCCELPEGHNYESFGARADGRIMGYLQQVLPHLLSCLASHITVTRPTGDFASQGKKPFVGCTYRSSTGYLYFMEDALMYGPKPFVQINFKEIKFIRINAPIEVVRAFDLVVGTTITNTPFEFMRIDKEEYRAIVLFVQSKNLRLQNPEIHNKALKDTTPSRRAGEDADVPFLGDEDDESDEDWQPDEDSGSEWTPGSDDDRRKRRKQS